MKKRIGFTLIELLIVIAIIAILAAIAIPNFLMAQTRSKVSRAKSEMKTLATALESYYVDNNSYPEDLDYPAPWYVPSVITTPVSYVSKHILIDPFRAGFYGSRPGWDIYERYRYVNYDVEVNGHWVMNWTGVPTGTANARKGRANYGKWRLTSAGPDRAAGPAYDLSTHQDPDSDILYLYNVRIYDPTNGTVSKGDIVRSQKHAEHAHEVKPWASAPEE